MVGTVLGNLLTVENLKKAVGVASLVTGVVDAVKSGETKVDVNPGLVTGENLDQASTGRPLNVNLNLNLFINADEEVVKKLKLLEVYTESDEDPNVIDMA